MASSINILSLNIGMSSSLAGLTSLIPAHNLDIIFLQEIRLTSEQINNFLDRLGFQAEVNIDQDHPSSPGTAIAWKKSLPVTDVNPLVLCRVQVATLGSCMLLNTYAPSGSEKKHERNVLFGEHIFGALTLNHEAAWVIGGDFNCVLKSNDIEGGVGFNQKFCPSLRDLVRTANLTDVYRLKNPRASEFTFFRAGRAPSRLDRFYISIGLVAGVMDVSHVASLSDHCGVLMQVQLCVEHLHVPKIERSTYWKLNTSILMEEDFLPHFTSAWRRMLGSRNKFSDIADWWDRLAKPEIKNFCIGYSINRKYQRNNTKKFLLSYLKLVLAKKNWDEVARIKEKLDIMIKADAMGFVVRSRYNQNAEGERASLYHAAREAKNGKNRVGGLRVAGNVVKNKNIVEKEVLKYFGALLNGHHNVELVDTGIPFVPDNHNLGEFLEGLGQLSDEDRDKLHRDIENDEMAEVIKNCANNKAPVLDGISYEFYKTTWVVISDVFIQVLQCQLDRFKIIDSNTMGATRLGLKYLVSHKLMS